MTLPRSFFTRTDVVLIAQELLGKLLVTEIDGIRTAGMIVETEAYAGIHDRACHAYSGRKRKRTETMYQQGGIAYVYLIYGLYHLFNIVTHQQDEPYAVLIRAIEPVEGIDTMLARRRFTGIKPSLTSGPGVLSIALGITKSMNGMAVEGSAVFVEDHGIFFTPNEIISGPRIGVGYAGDSALLPYRFYVRGNKFVSKAKIEF